MNSFNGVLIDVIIVRSGDFGSTTAAGAEMVTGLQGNQVCLFVFDHHGKKEKSLGQQFRKFPVRDRVREAVVSGGISSTYS